MKAPGLNENGPVDHEGGLGIAGPDPWLLPFVQNICKLLSLPGATLYAPTTMNAFLRLCPFSSGEVLKGDSNA